MFILQPLRASCACVALGCVYSFSENDKNIGDGRQLQQQHAIVTSCVRLMHSLQCSIGVGSGGGGEQLQQSNCEFFV
jgi:hypothetical protein